MTKRKVLGAAALLASLAGGGVAGALMGTPSLGFAQEDGTTTEAETADNDEDRRRRHGGPRAALIKHELIETAAEALGMEASELREALADGSTIAEIAAEQDVDVQAVIDALVASAIERIDAAVADGRVDAERAEEMKEGLQDRMDVLVNRPLHRGGEGPGARHRGGHGSLQHLGGQGPLRHLGAGRGELVEAAAEALGMEASELREALSDGSTIAEIAAEQDVDVQAVIDALVATATERIDARVSELEEALPERIEDFVNGELGPGGRGHEGKPEESDGD